MRFKCVSKLWSCLICSRFFSNRYLTVASPTRPPRVYMSLVDHLECDSMEVCHNPGQTVLLSLSSSSSNSVESLDPNLTLPGMGGDSMVVHRGLSLYIVCIKACIYNPATRQSITLPAIKSNMFAQEEYLKSAVYFLGHGLVLDQYKVVCTVAKSSEVFERITSEHWVFLLEAGGSWKRIEFDQPHITTSRGLCVNGVIFYLTSTCYSRSIVVSFDVRSEEFNMTQVPHVIGDCTGFIENDGKPAIFDHTNLIQTGLVDLWVLGDGGRWSTKSLVLQPRQMHLVDSDITLIVEGTTQNGEVILSPFDLISHYYMIYYDLQKNDMRKVIIRGIPEHYFGKLDETFLRSYIIFMDKNESIMHLET